MSLPSNLIPQLSRRAIATIQKLYPGYTVTALDTATLQVNTGGTVTAVIGFIQKSFNGFNIVAELSSSAGNGQPETECWLDLNTAASIQDSVQLSKVCANLGCASIKLVTSAAPAATDLVDTNLIVEIPNSAELGASGV